MFGRQRALDVVQGDHDLSGPCPSDDDLVVRQAIVVERVDRMPELEHHEVGDINDVADAPRPDASQGGCQPRGRRSDRHIGDDSGYVPWAAEGILDLHGGHLGGRRARLVQVNPRQPELGPGQGRHLTRDAYHTEA